MEIYLDNGATTKPSSEVIQSMTEVLERFYGNPSSLHHMGLEAEKLLSHSKEVISQLLQIESNEIVYTSGGTESNNLAIKGVAFEYQKRGKHIITSQIEHSSVYDTCQVLERDFGFEITYLPVNQDGQISLEDLKHAIRSDTILVSIMHVNNEIGTVQPIEQIGNLLKQYPKVLFHVDQVQGVGKAPLHIKESAIDLLSISGHKLYAPKGTGLLYVRDGVKLYPLFHGGSQQGGIRPGTENIPGIVALAKAIRLIKESEIQAIRHMQSLKKRLIEGVSTIEGVWINSPLEKDKSAPHIVNLSFKGLKPEVLLHALEEKGIYISTKSACSSKIPKPSRILAALNLPDEVAMSAIRISFSVNNTVEEIDYLCQQLQEMIPHFYEVMKPRSSKISK